GAKRRSVRRLAGSGDGRHLDVVRASESRNTASRHGLFLQAPPLAEAAMVRHILVLLILGALTAVPALAFADESPEAVLEAESRDLRQHLMDADGFIGRMERYRQFADGIRELTAVLEPLRPILDEFESMQPYVDMGLLDMLA